MGDALNGAAGREASEERRLAETARMAARGALSGTTVAAAQAALAAVQGADGGSAIAEPARDLRRLRSSGPLIQALGADLRLAHAAAEIFLADALWMGYRTGAAGRSAGLPVRVDLTDQDRAELADYPVHGFTTAEIAGELIRQLGRDVDRALAMPLTGTIDPAAIPGALQAVAEAHAGRLAGAVGEAHAVGVGAAVRALGRALAGAA